MKKLLPGVLAAAALTLGFATSADAAGPPKCGGQGAYRTTPYSCFNEKKIDGVLIRVDVHVEQTGAASVLYSLPNGPIDRIIGLQIVAHTGFSGADGPALTKYDTMPAGADTFPLGIAFPSTGKQPNCGNQFDIKAVPGQQGTPKHLDGKYRVSGATFTFPACTTVAPPSPPTPPSGPTTAAASTPGVPATPGVPSTKPAEVAGCTLNSSGVYVNASDVPCSTPATGSGVAAIWLGLGILVGGAALIVVAITRRQPAR